MSQPLCQCGCGDLAPLADRTSKTRGTIKGQPLRYIKGHFFIANKFVFRGAESGAWKGGKVLRSHGYICMKSIGHPSADMNGYVYEHVLVAEKAMGRYLPDGTEIHHVNGNKADNRPSNLVICENHAYHSLLHLRKRALEITGNPRARKCWICGTWDEPSNLRFISTRPKMAYHLLCNRKSMQKRNQNARDIQASTKK